MYDTRTAADRGDYDTRHSNTNDLQLHRRRHYPSNAMSGYSRHDQPHFPTKPNQLGAVHCERNTYITNDRQSSERRPLRIRSDHYQYYTDKG